MGFDMESDFQGILNSFFCLWNCFCRIDGWNWKKVDFDLGIEASSIQWSKPRKKTECVRPKGNCISLASLCPHLTGTSS